MFDVDTRGLSSFDRPRGGADEPDCKVQRHMDLKLRGPSDQVARSNLSRNGEVSARARPVGVAEGATWRH